VLEGVPAPLLRATALLADALIRNAARSAMRSRAIFEASELIADRTELDANSVGRGDNERHVYGITGAKR
jgi:hypothetical protein